MNKQTKNATIIRTQGNHTITWGLDLLPWSPLVLSKHVLSWPPAPHPPTPWRMLSSLHQQEEGACLIPSSSSPHQREGAGVSGAGSLRPRWSPFLPHKRENKSQACFPPETNDRAGIWNKCSHLSGQCLCPLSLFYLYRNLKLLEEATSFILGEERVFEWCRISLFASALLPHWESNGLFNHYYSQVPRS